MFLGVEFLTKAAWEFFGVSPTADKILSGVLETTRPSVTLGDFSFSFINNFLSQCFHIRNFGTVLTKRICIPFEFFVWV